MKKILSFFFQRLRKSKTINQKKSRVFEKRIKFGIYLIFRDPTFLNKKEKTKNILLANKYAIEIPYQTAKKCYEVMQLVEILIDKGNSSLLTDACTASEVAFAGLRGGCINVLINLPELIDKTYINQKQKEVDSLLKKGEKLNSNLFKRTISLLEMTK